LIDSKPKNNSRIVLASNHDEQSDARERGSRAESNRIINRRRSVIGDVLLLAAAGIRYRHTPTGPKSKFKSKPWDGWLMVPRTSGK